LQEFFSSLTVIPRRDRIPLAAAAMTGWSFALEKVA
jgi:hypothetical protein